MKLYDFLLSLRNDVPIEVLLIEPPTHPDSLESVTLLYRSSNRCTYAEYLVDFNKLFSKDYEVISISLSDSDYEFRLVVRVVV